MVRLPNLSKLNFGLLCILIPPASVSGQDAGVDEYGTPAPTIESAGRMRLPDGFRVDLVAAEPDIRQPIAFTMMPEGIFDKLSEKEIRDLFKTEYADRKMAEGFQKQ